MSCLARVLVEKDEANYVVRSSPCFLARVLMGRLSPFVYQVLDNFFLAWAS